MASDPIRATIIASLQAGYLDVLLGSEYGMLNGGVIQRIEVSYFPLNCRMPNTIINISFSPDGIPNIELFKESSLSM